MKVITVQQAEVVRAAIAAHFQATEDNSPKLFPGSHEGLQTPGSWVISWEGDVEEWALRYSEIPNPEGFFFEPVMGCTLALYPQD
jgi:hypothetical protein